MKDEILKKINQYEEKINYIENTCHYEDAEAAFREQSVLEDVVDDLKGIIETGEKAIQPLCELNKNDFGELLRILRTYNKEQLAEVIYYSGETNKQTIELINEINLYIAGIKKVH